MGINIRHESNSDELTVALKNLEGKVGKVGWFENSLYEDGTPVASIAVQQEYGDASHGIPRRPFMRPTVISKQLEWQKVAERGAKAILIGKADANSVMEAIGVTARGDIQKAIANVFSPPLSPRTIQARLHRKVGKKTIGALDKPLIDTGIMFDTIINVVENE